MLIFYLFIIIISIILVFILIKNIFFTKDKINFNNEHLLDELKLQLKNLNIEFENNEINDDEHKSAKFEIEKRILKELKNIETKKIITSSSSIYFNKIFFFFSFSLIIIMTGLIYFQLGNYRLKDNPFSNINLISDNLNQTRLNQINAENLIEDEDFNFSKNNQLKELVTQLKEILKNRPNDLKGYNLLVENSARIGDFKTAHNAMLHIIENINATVNAKDYSKLAELMIAATDGYISIQAENNLVKSLHLDGTDKRARYYYGLLKLQKNNLEEGHKIWKNLLMEETEGSPWSKLINQDITRLESLIEAQKNSPLLDKSIENNGLTEDQKEMIYDMVSNLKERIDSEGGTFEEWFKLIRSYLVLGENEIALERLVKAKDIFKNNDDLLVRLESLIKSFLN
ncbi:MAG: c-type cytochrome biogenesis protein CcmI [Paracoccaceae bacterium]